MPELPDLTGPRPSAPPARAPPTGPPTRFPGSAAPPPASAPRPDLTAPRGPPDLTAGRPDLSGVGFDPGATFSKVFFKHLDDLGRDSAEILNSPTLGGRFLGMGKSALDLLGMTMMPVEMIATETIGKPIESMTGGYFSRSEIGEGTAMLAGLYLANPVPYGRRAA